MARAVYDFQSLNKKTAIGKMREAMSKEITQFDDAMFETRLDALVKARVEQIANAGRYEHKTSRKAFCAGHYERGLTAKVGKLELKVDDATLAKRRETWVCPPPNVTKGYLARYAKLVSSANKGAVVE